MALFLVVCGFVHAAAHAGQPVQAAILEVSAIGDDSSADGQLNVDASHCQFCAASSVPLVPATGAQDRASTQIAGPHLYDNVQDRKKTEPPPPKN